MMMIVNFYFQVLDEYMPNYKLSVETYCALTLVPLVLICQIRNLKWLVPFSAIANVFLVICFAITMYYIFNDLPSPAEREMVASVTQWPLFIRWENIAVYFNIFGQCMKVVTWMSMRINLNWPDVTRGLFVITKTVTILISWLLYVKIVSKANMLTICQKLFLSIWKWPLAGSH